MRKATVLILLSLLGCASLALAQSGNCLFFSEYIEGGSYNKAVEIYNATGEDIDLAVQTVTIVLYSNGASTPTASFTLSGIIENGGTHVVCHGSAIPAILAVADETSGVVNFNGDDAFELKLDGVTVDVIGQIGFDPGSTWPVSTVNNTLVRLDTVCCGDPDGSDAFDTTAEWTLYPQDTVDYLGSHTTMCAPIPTTGSHWGTIKAQYR